MSVASFRESLYSSNVETFCIVEGCTINEWLDSSGFRQRLEEYPIVVCLNGEELLEKDYDTVLRGEDVLELQQYPRGEGVVAVLTYIYYAVTIVMAIYVLTMPEPGLPDSADVKEGSPTYSVSAKGNRYRPDSRGSILYGTLRVVPDFDEPPYSTFDANDDQILHLLFRITQGHASVDVSSIKFEDTLLSNFSGVETEVIPPGQAPTLFPLGVVTSNDISHVELTSVPSTAYAASDVGTKTTKLAVDVGSPRICVQDKSTGSLVNHTVEFKAQAMEIDDAGAPVGSWFDLGVEKFTSSTLDPIRRTFVYTVPPARYQVRMVRVTAKNDSHYVNDTVYWESLKGHLHDPDNVTQTTRLAVTIRASEQIGNRALSDMSVIASRKLKTWDAETGWSAEEVETNSIGWALADLCRAEYAGNRSDLHYDLERLAELDAQLTPAGHEFNAYFDSAGTTVWDALIKAGTPGRITPIDKAGFYTFVRDEAQAQAVQAFTMRNIVRGSFHIEHAGVLEETADSVVVKFKDETNDYRERDITCALPDSPQLRPRKVNLFGVTNPTRAKELGMFLAACNRYRRKLTPFETGIEGRIPFYGQKIAISHFLLGAEGVAQVSGDIVAFDGVDRLRLSEKVTGRGFAAPHIVMIDKQGQPMPAYAVTILDDHTVQVSGSPDWTQIEIDGRHKRPMFMLGDGQAYVTYSKVRKVERDGMHVKIEAFEDDPRVYQYADGVEPPPNISIPGGQSRAPVLRDLEAHIGGTTEYPVVTLSWSLQNADRTEIEVSSDGGFNFAPLGRGFTLENEYVDRPAPGNYVYRLAAVNLFRGPWVSTSVDTGDAAFAIPPDPTDLALREPFTGPTLKLSWESDSYRHHIQVLVAGVLKYTDNMAVGNEWDFAGSLAQEYSIGRSFTVRVYAVGDNGKTSTGYAELAVSNPAPAQLSNLSVISLLGQAKIDFDWPADTDLLGVSVWKSATPGFTPSAINLAVDKSRDPVLAVPVEEGETTYLRVAAVDTWGDNGLNVSGEYTVTGKSVDLSELEGKFPITEVDIADDAISAPKLQANSVLAEKIAAYQIAAGHIAANTITADKFDVAQLSAIAADMGLVTAGTFQTTSGTTPRVVISSSGSFPLWVGNGSLVNASNGILYMDTGGNMVFKGKLEVKSATSGARLELVDDVIRVYDAGGVLRVKIGNLA